MTWEYIAGFFDGEGSIVTKRGGYALMVSQTNEEVLDEIAAYAKVGNVYALTKRKQHWKNAWVYCVTDYRGTVKVLEGMLPHLVVKKDLAQRALLQITKLLEIAELKSEKRSLRQRKARSLREKGFTFRAIGKALNIDFGYARKLVLSSK
jgi:LAGLIDADG-like domain